MELVKGNLYHVFNRGNNGERIFYSQANYQFFVQKLDYHILPYADIISWCLMPNHFHLMLYVNREKIFSVSINQSIGKMLSSYARAINIQENRKGSLFQQHSRSVRLNSTEKLKRGWYRTFGVTKIEAWNDKTDYPKICMNYIHLNPVNAGIVMNSGDWKWSSYKEIFGKVSGNELVNIERLKTVVSL